MEGIKWTCRWELTKMLNGKEIEKVLIPGNMLLTNGANAIWKLLTGDNSVTPFTANNTYIGVGDSATAVSPAQTDLQATTNKVYVKVEDGYPLIQGNQIMFLASFGENVANFDWNEMTIANGNSASKVCLNRKVQALGEKEEGIWLLKAIITIS